MQRISPDTFDRRPELSGRAGYICVLRDVSYGNRFKFLRVSGYTEFTKYGGEIFEVDLALVYQSDDAAADLRRLLDEVENARPDEWFDLDDQPFERLRNLGEQRGSRARPADADTTLSSLLNSAVSSRAHRPGRRSSRERESQPASQPRPRRRRSTAHRRTNRATSIPVQRDDNNAPPASGRSGRSRYIVFLIIIALLLGVLYGSITSRDPLADVMNLAETAISAVGSLAQPTPTATPLRLSRPKVKIASRSATSIRFSWEKVRLAHDYKYRHSLNGGGASYWKTTSATSITVSALSPGSRVEFLVRARHESGIYSTTASMSASTVTDRPPTATDLPPSATRPPPTSTATDIPPTATPLRLSKPKVKMDSRSATSIRFSWEKVPLAQDYQYRHRRNGRGASYWKTTSATSFTVYALSPGDRVQFFVRARQESGIYSTTARISASTVTDRPPTATDLPLSATRPPPTSTATDIPPTATRPPPTATLTATDIPPTATKSSTPTHVPPEIFFVETARSLNANIRSCPSTSCEIVAKFPPGAEVVALGQVEGETVYESNVWLEIGFDGGSAFIHSELVAEAG